MKINEIMTREPITIAFDATVQDLSDLIYGMSAHHIPVLREEKVVAIVSDRDLRSFTLPKDLRLVAPEIEKEHENTAVITIAHTDVLSLPPDAEVAQAIEIMLTEGIGAIPVVDAVSGKLLGIVSYEDILRVAIEFV